MHHRVWHTEHSTAGRGAAGDVSGRRTSPQCTHTQVSVFMFSFSVFFCVVHFYLLFSFSRRLLFSVLAFSFAFAFFFAFLFSFVVFCTTIVLPFVLYRRQWESQDACVVNALMHVSADSIVRVLHNCSGSAYLLLTYLGSDVVCFCAAHL